MADFTLESALEQTGLVLFGFCPALPDDRLPDLPGGVPASLIALIGNAGSSLWPHFTASAEFADGRADPLDRWSRRVLSRIAEGCGAGLLLPFEGPPYWPFQQWALRTESASQSPLGVLTHRVWGPWFAFRGALLLSGPAPRPAKEGGPCGDCAEKPCLDACPAGALTRTHGFDAAACRAHVAGEGRATCASLGCLVRHACPYGREYAYLPAQAAFHMKAFAG